MFRQFDPFNVTDQRNLLLVLQVAAFYQIIALFRVNRIVNIT